MKVRNGFVSNSSSSSFIVIEGEAKMPFPNKDVSYEIGKDATYDFGWESMEYTDSDDKICWCYLQLLYMQRDKDPREVEYRKMFFDILSEVYTSVKTDMIEELYQEYVAYIDHQSVYRENSENIKMFENKDTLRRFLFSSESYIQGGNDN